MNIFQGLGTLEGHQTLNDLGKKIERENEKRLSGKREKGERERSWIGGGIKKTETKDKNVKRKSK